MEAGFVAAGAVVGGVRAGGAILGDAPQKRPQERGQTHRQRARAISFRAQPQSASSFFPSKRLQQRPSPHRVEEQRCETPRAESSSAVTNAATPVDSEDIAWPWWPLVPLYPYGKRKTIRKEVVYNNIWTFDQMQGIFYVVVPVRMTVIRLRNGGLMVYAPVAPTRECIRMVRELEAAYGEVKYIIVPTSTGLEHKVFAGPFARRFPNARVYVARNAWSFPLNLPLSWLGLPGGRTQYLPETAAETPFGDEFDLAAIPPVDLGVGPFEEVALLHRATGTLMVTDALVSIPDEPPEIVSAGVDGPFPLLYHARDRASDPAVDTPENRRKGWHRVALFALLFRPSVLDVPTLGEALADAGTAPDRSRRNLFGLFPFKWRPEWEDSFHALRGEGRLLVAPILQEVLLPRDPYRVREWANTVAGWKFERIIPCHFDAPISATPNDFRRAFAFLERSSAPVAPPKEEDLSFMRSLENGLVKAGVIPARRPKL